MIQLKIVKRDAGIKIGLLRKQGLIPGIVYSKGAPGNTLAMPALAFEKIYNEAGESSLVDLIFENGASKKVLIHEVQNDPVKNKVLHVDFFEVDLSKKVTTNVELEFVGEAPIVKTSGGIVIKHLNEIEVECLPSDLIKNFKIDISGLDDFSSAIHISDLKIADTITILNEPGDVVVNVSEPRVVEEEAPAPVADAAAAAADATKTSGDEKAEGGGGQKTSDQSAGKNQSVGKKEKNQK